MDSLLIVVIAGAVVAGFVQGLSGFAFGMVAMSFWVWVVDPHVAAAMSVFGALVGQLVAAVSVRRAVDWKMLWPYLAGGLVGIPIGVVILPSLQPDYFKLGLGILLALWCPVMLFAKRLPQVTVGGRGADGAVGMVGGVLAALGGIAGIIPTLWCTLRGYPRHSQRAVIQNFNLAMQAVTMTTYLATGIVTRDMWPMFAIVAPAMLIPTLLGTRLYHGISDTAFRRIVLVLLTVSGIAMLGYSLPRVFGS